MVGEIDAELTTDQDQDTTSTPPFALLVASINVVTVAILGTPRFRYFGDDRLNVWVT